MWKINSGLDSIKKNLDISIPTSFFIIIVLLVSFGVYANTLFNDFVIDDRHVILNNPWITDIKYIPTIFTSSVWSFQSTEKGLSNHYRPIHHLIYMVNYHIFGLKPWGFHLVNNLFHSVTSVIVLFIAFRLLNDLVTTGTLYTTKDVSPFSWQLAPLFIALLFATHPVNTEAVAWVAATSELSFALFYLLSFYLYISSPCDGSKRYWFSVGSFLLAAFSKETSASLPLLLIAYDYIVKRVPISPVLTWVKRYLPYLLAGIIYLGARYYALGGITPLKAESPPVITKMILNFFPLVGIFLIKLIFPVRLVHYEFLELTGSIMDYRVIFSLLAVIVLIFFAVKVSYRERIVLFGLLWLFIPLLPVFHISLVKGSILPAERYLYIPTVAFALLLIMGFIYVNGLNIRRQMFITISSIGIIIVLLSAFSYGTFRRNYAWRNELTIWTDTIKKAPHNKYAHNNLGIELVKRGLLNEAITEFRKSLEIDPNHISALNNLGIALAQKGELMEAVVEFQKALAINPDNAEVLKNLDKALKLLKK